MAAKAKNVELTEALLKLFKRIQTSKMELFVKIVNNINLLSIFTKSPILDI